MSDAGSVKIGNDSFTILVPNGYGDGFTDVVVLSVDEDFEKDGFRFFTSVDGTFNIYSYDCGDKVKLTISGNYGIYYKDGFVVFEQWR